MPALSVNVGLEIAPLNKLDGEPIMLQSQKGKVMYEMSMKPGKDRVYISGFSPIPESNRIVFDNGFLLRPVHANGEQMAFDIETLVITKEKGIENCTIVAVRQAETFLDQPLEEHVEGSLESVLTKLIGTYNASFSISSLSGVNVDVSPAPGVTRRDVIQSLSEEHEFFWCLSSVGDGEFLFFTAAELTSQYMQSPEEVNPSNIIPTSNGWTARFDDLFFPLGSTTTIAGKKMTCVVTKMITYQNASGEQIVNFIDADVFKSFSATELRKIRSNQERMLEDIDYKALKIGLILADDFSDDTISGSYVDSFKMDTDPGKTTSASGIRQLSPWATTDGYGMTFPFSEKPRETVVVQLSPTQAVTVGDVARGVGDGKNFLIMLPGDAYLEYDTTTKTWTMHADNIKLGEEASDPVIRKSDLENWTTLQQHVHAGFGVPPTSPIVTPSGSSKVKSL